MALFCGQDVEWRIAAGTKSPGETQGTSATENEPKSETDPLSSADSMNRLQTKMSFDTNAGTSVAIIKGKTTLGCVFIFLMLCGASARAQSRYNDQIQPGLSTRTDVDQALGQPLRQVNPAAFEYTVPPGLAKLQIQYQADGVVERVVTQFSETYDRASMLEVLKITKQSVGARIAQNHLYEYFGAPLFLVFIYSSVETGSGVMSLTYCTPAVFQREVPPSAESNPAPGTGTSAVSSESVGDFVVKLLNPLGATSSSKGDAIHAQVLFPEAYRGDILQGTIRDSKGTDAASGRSLLNLSFEILNHDGQDLPVRAAVTSVFNSKGQQGVDDEGHAVRWTGNFGKVIAGEAISASIRGPAGGNSGFGVVQVVFVELSVGAANISLAPGSRLVVSLKSDPHRQAQK